MFIKKRLNLPESFSTKKAKKTYVLEKEDISEGETELRIFYENITILKIKFSSCSPIEFEFLKNETSYEDLFKYYQDKMQLETEKEKIIEVQEKLQDIINFDQKAIEEVKIFYKKYLEYFSINLDQVYSWYSIKCHDLKHI